MGNERRDLFCARDFANDVSIAAKVGECVSDKYQRANQRELTKRLNTETTRDERDKKYGKPLRGEAGA